MFAVKHAHERAEMKAAQDRAMQAEIRHALAGSMFGLSVNVFGQVIAWNSSNPMTWEVVS